MWFSILPLWFRVSPRYLYVFVYYSNFMFPRYISGLCCPLPILRFLLFASPRSMWYLLAISCVIFSIACSSSVSDDTSATSFIHRMYPVDCYRLSNFGPSFCFGISLFISSIINAHCITDSTPPCLMLSLWLILRVSPYLVLSLAVEFVFVFVSYAFVTSRKAMYAGLCFGLILLILLFGISRWSVVDFPFWPPAWASFILTFGSILLLISLSNTVPKLLARVIPRSFEHFPFVHFPLHCLIISPSSHCSGCLMFVLFCLWFLCIFV